MNKIEELELAGEAPGWDAFLSYSGRDREFAERLREDLTEAQQRIFMDSHSLRTRTTDRALMRGHVKDGGAAAPVAGPSEGVIDQLRTALLSARHLLLLLTPESLDSSWVQAELGAIRSHAIASEGKGTRLVVLTLEWARIPEGLLPPRFERSRRWLDFERGDLSYEDYRAKYQRTLRALLRHLGSRRQPKIGPEDVLPGRAITLPRQGRKLLTQALTEVLGSEHSNDAHPRHMCDAVCAGMELDPAQLEFSRQPLADHTELIINHLLVQVARRWTPWRGMARLARFLVRGFRIEDGALRNDLKLLAEELDSRTVVDLDDRFVGEVEASLFPRYEVTKVLGGTTTISLSLEDISLGRKVVAKALRPFDPKGIPVHSHISDEDRVASFRILASECATAHYAGVGRVHGVRFEKEVDLIIMERLEQESLASIASHLHVQRGIECESLGPLLSGIGSILTGVEGGGHLHLDLSARKVFVHQHGRVALGPFGMVSQQRSARLFTSLFAFRQARWLPPELHRAERAEPSVMQWWFGALAARLLLGRDLVKVMPHATRLARVDRLHNFFDEVLEDRKGGPQGVRELSGVMARLLCPEASGRFGSMSEAVRRMRSSLEGVQARRERSGGRGAREVVDLATAIESVRGLRRSSEEQRHLVADSLARATREGLIGAFRKSLWRHRDIQEVFKRHRKDREQAQWVQEYERQLGLALRTIVTYGVFDGYRPIALDRLAVRHGPGEGNFDVKSEHYAIFNRRLLGILRRTDPQMAKEHPHSAVLVGAWTEVLRRVTSELLRPAEEFVVLPSTKDEGGPPPPEGLAGEQEA